MMRSLLLHRFLEDPISGKGTVYTFGCPRATFSQDTFIAYNDFSWGEGQRSAHVTRYTTNNGEGLPPEGDSGQFIDYRTSQRVRAQLTVTGGAWNGDKHANFGIPFLTRNRSL